MRLFCLSVLIALMMAGAALASEFDGLTVAQIKAHPGFVASDYSLSSAKNSGDPNAKHVYWWIGYIPSGDKRVYFERAPLESCRCIFAVPAARARAGGGVPDAGGRSLRRALADSRPRQGDGAHGTPLACQ